MNTGPNDMYENQIRERDKHISELLEINGRLRRRLKQCEQSNLTICKVIEWREDHTILKQILRTYPTASGVVVEIQK